MLPSVFVKRSDEKDNASGLEYERANSSGPASAPYVESWSEIGFPSAGPESVETINVTGIEVEPESSVATKLKETGPASWGPGVP